MKRDRDSIFIGENCRVKLNIDVNVSNYPDPYTLFAKYRNNLINWNNSEKEKIETCTYTCGCVCVRNGWKELFDVKLYECSKLAVKWWVTKTQNLIKAETKVYERVKRC